MLLSQLAADEHLLSSGRQRATFAGFSPLEGPAQVPSGPMRRDSRFRFEPLNVFFFYYGWSLLNHGAAEIKGCDLGNLNPIYERELNKPDVHQRKGMWNVSICGEGGKGCQHKQQ